MMIWYGDGMGWWGYAAMGIGMVLFWALLVGGIVLLIKLAAGDATQPIRRPLSAEQLLAARFAGGEITEAEYHDRLQVLRGAPRTTP
ncbi:SHOCT domain-containing protein [Mycolicibacterium sp. GF69]|uniref:SHOCT domain-containing protein n=1 Tax=Mycobacteriaceae TaxID=1762 RepID=UPI000DCEEEA5|nr:MULTISPECIES: SHOCT domain-containing protein [Mycobacteriaceae]MDV3136718.1 SHOCT domain-containing protein [Mycobacterium sp. 29Ha]RAV09536.1 SHOCT domain-containing protein [Mycolicibacterium sp. GF69]WSE55925.1 SHOCT domain-containing protein [Mycolicibacterium sp. ND9-15]